MTTPHLAGIRQAWSWAAKYGDPSLLTGALEGLMRFWELTCEYTVAEALLAQAAGAVEGRSAMEIAIAAFEGHSAPRQSARALQRLGTAYWRVGDYDPAVQHLQCARDLAGALGDVWE